LYQPDFSIALAKAAKEKNIHVCVETSGFGKVEKILELSRYTDIFLFDYKATGDEHKKHIGENGNLILSNLFLLDEQGKKIILRCPIIPGKNLNEKHISGIVDVAGKIKNLLEIDLEPYHSIGVEKKKGLGMRNENEKIGIPSKQLLRHIAESIQSEVNVKTVIM